MRKLKVCLAVLIIAMMMGGSAWAFNDVDHIKVAPNGKGDLLIFPYYFAYPGDYTTKITVINTSSTQSVVAKVVYRSFNWSEEVRDHLIFLSPNDVWTGTLVNVKGVPRLQSNDDSILGRMPSGTAAAADSDFGNITPVDINLLTPTCTDDASTMGYIEVIECASRVESKATTGYEPGQRVAKRHIYDWYYNYVTEFNIQNGPYSPVNVLTGYQENSFGWGYTLKQANVFSDYFNFTKWYGIEATTPIGVGANNTTAEFEAAIGKHAISLPYIAKANGDSSVHIFNFPSKMSFYNPDSKCSYYRVNPLSPYWLLVNSKCESYTRNIYDLSENTPVGTYEPFSPPTKKDQLSMCGEVEFNVQMASDPAYSEGWIRYTHGNAATVKNGLTKSNAPISYTGIPVLASVLYWSVSRDNPAEANAAYTDGVVRVANTLMPYYQYSE